MSLTRGVVITPCSHITDTIARTKVREMGNDGIKVWTHYADMDRKPPHYLREWRSFRKMTQQALADAINTSKSAISDLERCNLQLSPKWLNRLAPVLKTQPGYILDHHPEELDSDIIDIWARIPERDKATAAKVLLQFTKTGTDNA